MWNIIALALTVQKVMSKVKVFKKWVKLQNQGHRVKNNGIHGKVLSQGILMWKIKALVLTVQKLLARLKFQRGGQNDRITEWQTGQNQYAPRSSISGAYKPKFDNTILVFVDNRRDGTAEAVK